jgi:hypothetical protein
MNRIVLNCKRVWRLKKHVWLLTALQHNGPTIEELFVDMCMSYSILVELTPDYIDQRNILKCGNLQAGCKSHLQTVKSLEVLLLLRSFSQMKLAYETVCNYYHRMKDLDGLRGRKF